MTSLLKQARNDALAMFRAGLKAVAPRAAINRYCKRQGRVLTIGTHQYNLDCYEQVYIVGAGKATAPMAQAFESLLGDKLTAGVISVKYDHTTPLKSVKIIEAGHPVPDRNGQIGSAKILEIAQNATAHDLCICLLSGGGSALLPVPVTGVSLEDKQQTTRVLLACGATIQEVNTLRKHLSQIKGGQLAVAAYPATVVSLMLSDVVGDDLEVIASGPTVADRTTFADCHEIIKKYGITERLSEAVLEHLKNGKKSPELETPKADNPRFEKTRNLIIGSNIEALQAAKNEAEKRGYQSVILSSMIEGETAAVARFHTAIAREIGASNNPLAPPVCILSGGETTVTLSGGGMGGRNQQFALCAAPDIAGEDPVVVLCAGTDGTDGPTDAAGAIADNTTLERAQKKVLDYKNYLAENDAYHFFQELDDLLITGPTKTNVMDLRIMVIPATET